MKAFKLFYLFNFLLAIKFFAPSLCNVNLAEEGVTEEVENLLTQEELELREKRKKIILYGAIASAVAVALATVTGVGLYCRDRKNKRVWDLDKEGYAAGRVFNEVLEKSREKVRESVKSGKSYNDSVLSIKEISNMIRDQSKDVKELSSGQVSALAKSAAKAIRLQLISEGPSDEDPKNKSS